MPDQLPIPNPDVIAVPGEIGMILFLLYMTFFVHVVLMNTLLGGVFMTFLSEVILRTTKNEETKAHHEHLAEKLGHILPFTVSLTITFGIAPLLFVQAVYGQFFYTSSVLMAWIWLSVVLLIILGYYSLYLYTRGFERFQNRRYIFMGFSLIMFLTIAFIYVNNLTLMQTPQKWLAIYTQTAGSGWHWNTDEQTLIPRYLHFVFSALAVAGMLVMILGMREKKNEAQAHFMVRWGGLWFLGATIIQIGVGLWFYYAIPENVRAIFSSDDGSAKMLFMSAHVMFIVGTACIAAATFLKNRSMVAWIGIAAVLIGIVEKVVNRDQLRQAYLREVNWSFDVLKTDPQYSVIALFFVFLVTGLGTLIWVLLKYKKEVKEHPAG
jgi:hypothetical protein